MRPPYATRYAAATEGRPSATPISAPCISRSPPGRLDCRGQHRLVPRRSSRGRSARFYAAFSLIRSTWGSDLGWSCQPERSAPMSTTTDGDFNEGRDLAIEFLRAARAAEKRHALRPESKHRAIYDTALRPF